MRRRVFYVLPACLIEDEFFRRLNFLKVYLDAGTCAIFCTAAALPGYARYCQDVRVRPAEFKADDFDILVVSREEDNTVDQLLLYSYPGKRAYVLEAEGRLNLISPDRVDAIDWPHSRTHVFNAEWPSIGDGEYYYFPYGYLLRYTGLGPIDAFGFRVAADLPALKRRDANHRLILVFGGSSAWSMLSYATEMFSTVLENKLNRYCAERKIDLRFTVLNYGQHGHIVLNEMLTYLLFCQALRPDFVIAHDGWNDMIYGMVSDKHLLNEHQIAYQNNLEAWPRMLHQGEREEAGFNYEVKNIPQNVVRAYVTRKQQFAALVDNSGGVFISGLQPTLFDKRVLSARERKAFSEENSGTNSFADAYEKIPFLYRKLADQLPTAFPGRFVDVNSYFSALETEETLFGDTMHTTPLGDEAIAECYFRNCQKLFFPPGQHG